MLLSKLQKFYPSAIDKSAMVFIPPLSVEKRTFHFNNFGRPGWLGAEPGQGAEVTIEVILSL
jgi:hypothetical protein